MPNFEWISASHAARNAAFPGDGGFFRLLIGARVSGLSGARSAGRLVGLQALGLCAQRVVLGAQIVELELELALARLNRVHTRPVRGSSQRIVTHTNE